MSLRRPNEVETRIRVSTSFGRRKPPGNKQVYWEAALSFSCSNALYLAVIFLVFRPAAASAGWWWAAVPLAVAVCLAAFVQMHDAMHNALGLSKAANERILALSALLILKSGHAMQVTHLRHHGRCLTEEDPEGAPANWRFSRVLWQGPYHILTLRRESWKIAPTPAASNLLRRATR